MRLGRGVPEQKEIQGLVAIEADIQKKDSTAQSTTQSDGAMTFSYGRNQDQETIGKSTKSSQIVKNLLSMYEGVTKEIEMYFKMSIGRQGYAVGKMVTKTPDVICADILNRLIKSSSNPYALLTEFYYWNIVNRNNVSHMQGIKHVT